MSSTRKYLEITSSRRDRTLWPLPSQFEVVLSQGGTNDARSAIDPVSLSAPLEEWFGHEFVRDVASSAVVSGTVLGGVSIGALNSPNVVVATSAAPNQWQTADDYYKYATLTTNVGKTRILKYTFLGNDRAEFVVETPLVGLLAGTAVDVTDPTDVNSNRVFVPDGSSVENAYVGYLLYNETLHESLRIASYVDGIVYAPGSMTGWSNDDSYVIRKEVPTLSDVVGALSTTRLLHLGAVAIGRDLVGNFVRIENEIADTPPSSEVRRIVSSDPLTGDVVVFPELSADPSGFRYEILQFSYDNYNPLSFIGGVEYEDSIYDISLLSVIIPNSLLVTGGYISRDYPYVYVELMPLTASSGYTRVMRSNNPTSTTALFRAAYNNNDRSSTENTFCHFIGDNMRPRLKTRVQSTFRFRVLLPNGDAFETVAAERFSPNAPNAALQITALFEFKKV